MQSSLKGPIRLSADGRHFEYAETGQRYIAWGCNYDRDDAGRLLEDYWLEEWDTVVEDFGEMRALGANVVRVHLQLGRFMEGVDQPNAVALKQLARLLELAEDTGLYLDITGLGCYHREDIPAWYEALDEAQRWQVQAQFWVAVAAVGAASDAVFCYDLMNEPIVPGAETIETDWLAGAFAGKYFVQRIALDLAGRTPQQVAGAWVRQLVAAIRRRDRQHLVTVGAIPWVHAFPQAKPLFYDPEVSQPLDFVSVHFYPKAGEVEQALTALKAYAMGKPLVIEELFPLWCSVAELDAFVEGARPLVDGYVGFYWGKTIEEHAGADLDEGARLTRDWLLYFRDKGASILGPKRS